VQLHVGIVLMSTLNEIAWWFVSYVTVLNVWSCLMRDLDLRSRADAQQKSQILKELISCCSILLKRN
jgi:hypothetical protein